MPFYCLLLFLAACALPASAQTYGRSLTAPTNLEFISQQLGNGKGGPALVGVVGTPDVAPGWTLGRVQTTNGPVGRVWLKYNLATDQLLWRRPVGDSLELNTAQIREFTLGDSLRGTRITLRRYLSARIEAMPLRTAFFEVRYDAGKAALLCQRTKRVVRGGSGPSLTEGRPPSWQETTEYFLKRHDNVILPVRLGEKTVLAALGADHAPDLAAYVKREHLALRKDADVVRLLAYYDTL